MCFRREIASPSDKLLLREKNTCPQAGNVNNCAIDLEFFLRKYPRGSVQLIGYPLKTRCIIPTLERQSVELVMLADVTK